MTDKELLERAAQAAGLRISNRCVDGGLMVMSDARRSPHKWNPLADDGDAMRLSVQLSMDVCQTGRSAQVLVIINEECDVYDATETHDCDPCAATRRAIVRAAAELVP